MSQQDPPLLADGTEPARPDDLFARLAELGIEIETISHPPVFTVEEAKALRGEIQGCHTKNLFLRNKKGTTMWLVVCPEDRAIDMKGLGATIGGGRLSFGSADRLMKYLGVIPGAVTPLAIINDRERRVRVVIDRDLLDASVLNFHPLDNAMTTAIRPDDFVRFLDAEHHSPNIIRIG
jgi:Ala-tRNA(Pro) deacylase